ncbi:lactate utilization protein [Enterococcus sp. BWM-S5]|uniref:Lactate utilization protein n=2 Tax=Enterococcus larvae TaxID=2794352 RepID=A0ABS4CIU5_9ENTE|nr:lactate utilization protein [Enterococcus larvae]
MEAYQKKYYSTAAEKIKRKLSQRNFNVVVCDTLEAAKEAALLQIPSEAVVAFGGSITIEQSGIIDALYSRNQSIINRELAADLTERHQLMKKSLLSDIYLTSINGLTDDGILVNMDSVGNRVAALTYGPDKVFIFVGINKVYGDLDTTISMVRNKTAPKNSFRLELQQTPCIKTGNCGDCLKDECICSTLAITRRSKLADRITLFLILEDVGL